MSAAKKYYTSFNTLSVFEIKIDTRLVDSSKTDGSQNNMRFSIPFDPNTGGSISVVLQVSDARPDAFINNANYNVYRYITFASPGIYTIKLIGMCTSIGFRNLPDRLKIIEINSFGRLFNYAPEAFYACENLLIKAKDSPSLIGNLGNMFNNIKGFDNEVMLNTWDINRITGMPNFFANTAMEVLTVPQGYLTVDSIAYAYQDAKLSNVSRIEIISDNITSCLQFLAQSTFKGELILRTPNNTNIINLLFAISNPSSLGQVDVRNVTLNSNFITTIMSTANVDSTLIGWSNLPFMQSGVVWDWRGSKYSNNPAVLAAYNKITQQWGVIFQNLTMA